MRLNELKEEKCTIIELLRDFGIGCKLILEENSPNRIIYHLNLHDITKITLIPKIIKYLSAYLHTTVNLKKSQVGHFALSIDKVQRNKVNYNEKRIEKAISSSKSLSIMLGIDEHNQPKLVKLEDLPHLLIAGTTGSGKSNLLNNIICSLLMQSKKHNFELVLLDPKRVEFSQYANIKQLGLPVAHSPEECLNVLRKANTLIDLTYEEMQKQGIKKLQDDDIRTIIIIDEFADLMLLAREQVERYLVRIAQLGRACGVHLIISTQRPSADVITGLIKSNIPSRIALKTASYRDSMIILDEKGAENLIGEGDALMKINGEFQTQNIQCPYINDEMIKKIIGESND